MNEMNRDLRCETKGKKSAREKKVKVTVTADPGTEGRLVDWTYDAKFDDGGGSNDKDVMKFDKDSGAHRIEFSFRDRTGFGLKFYRQPSDAMWVAPGKACPPPGPGNGNGEILLCCVNETQDVLTVINLNNVAGDFCYALRFEGQAQLNVPPYVFDPIMNNGGGNGGFI